MRCCSRVNRRIKTSGVHAGIRLRHIALEHVFIWQPTHTAEGSRVVENSNLPKARRAVGPRQPNLRVASDEPAWIICGVGSRQRSTIDTSRATARTPYVTRPRRRLDALCKTRRKKPWSRRRVLACTSRRQVNFPVPPHGWPACPARSTSFYRRAAAVPRVQHGRSRSPNGFRPNSRQVHDLLPHRENPERARAAKGVLRCKASGGQQPAERPPADLASERSIGYAKAGLTPLQNRKTESVRVQSGDASDIDYERIVRLEAESSRTACSLGHWCRGTIPTLRKRTISRRPSSRTARINPTKPLSSS